MMGGRYPKEEYEAYMISRTPSSEALEAARQIVCGEFESAQKIVWELEEMVNDLEEKLTETQAASFKAGAEWMGEQAAKMVEEDFLLDACREVDVAKAIRALTTLTAHRMPSHEQ